MLGVIINQSLTWNDHISVVKQKVSKSIGIIKRVRKNLLQSVLITLYFSLVHPYLEYCIVILCGVHVVLLCLIAYLSYRKKAVRAINFVDIYGILESLCYRRAALFASSCV